jgi:hypothetical protein
VSTVHATVVMGRGGDHGRELGFDQSGTVNIKVDSSVLGSGVQVTATLGVRYWSDNWDDDHEGVVHFAVVVEFLLGMGGT